MRLNRTLVSAFAAVSVVALALRLYNLDVLPGEWYGDISIVNDYVSSIQSLHWPVGFTLSAGPFYHYLITPVVATLGHSYLSFKLASVIVSLLAIVATMLLAYEIGGSRLSLLAGLISGASSWLLVFSRLGNSQIAIPALTGFTGYFLARYARTGRQRDAVLGAAISAIGLYSYPQTFILPAVSLLILAFYSFRSRRQAYRDFLVSCLVVLAVAVPFVFIVTGQSDNFQTGYVGDKFFGTGQESIDVAAVTLARNLLTTALMLHVRGDVVFRSNPPQSPQLDLVSGLFFILGMLDLIFGKKRRFLPLILISLAILIVPGAWPFLPPSEIPSASRTLGITPFVYLLVADGLLWLYYTVKGELGKARYVGARRIGSYAIVGAAVGVILILNGNRYFVTYAWGLPNHNTAYDKIIASKINALPADASVYLGGCCWGDWGQPEPDGIVHELQGSRDVTFLQPEQFSCGAVQRDRSPQYFFWDPRDKSKGFARLKECLPGGQEAERRSQYGDIIYLEYRWTRP